MYADLHVASGIMTKGFGARAIISYGFLRCCVLLALLFAHPQMRSASKRMARVLLARNATVLKCIWPMLVAEVAVLPFLGPHITSPVLIFLTVVFHCTFAALRY